MFDTFIHATEVRRVDAAIMSGNIVDAQARVAHQLLGHLDDVEVLEFHNVITGEHRDKGSQLRRGNAFGSAEGGTIEAARHDELQVAVHDMDARRREVAFEGRVILATFVVEVTLAGERRNVELFEGKLGLVSHKRYDVFDVDAAKIGKIIDIDKENRQKSETFMHERLTEVYKTI